MSHSLSADAMSTLPPLAAQAERLIELGAHELAGLPADTLRAFAVEEGSERSDTLLAIHRELAPASALTPLLCRADKTGFVVEDMPDVDHFAPTVSDVPDAPLYLVGGLDRGDAMANWSPEEALSAITEEGRSPLLLTEGVHWVLQHPDVLERNHCFMTIGSRLRKANGSYDSRTPALWISNGTGRDGRERRNAPKVGWCWWRNRHTWLGIASTSGRSAVSR
ncbi:hypothetical protein SAMN05444695_103107 [Rhodococcus triatomae]|uniref:Uncharacterized protein n=1 Tax=Rhodococcus triatomae TaxID=300028 RepID=A0A1G8EYS9_9NOCA|nr:DUF5701 family protein [Rhodococcus triatomae]SDH75002.1 hypothetical protein SAMN05444695_103107 [Rhodococcus triatomae]